MARLETLPQRELLNIIRDGRIGWFEIPRVGDSGIVIGYAPLL